MIALYYYRLDVGLEPESIHLALPEFPNFENCHDDIIDDFRDLEDDIVIGLNTVNDFENQEQFLKDVAQWIRGRPSTGPNNLTETGHGFTAEDNAECMVTFFDIEQAYLNTLSEQKRVEDELNALYGNILAEKGDYRLVDNEAFILWVATYE